MATVKVLRLVLYVLFFAVNAVFAQGVGTNSGTLSGIAIDEKSSPLAGVIITVTGATGSKIASTDHDGKFVFPQSEFCTKRV